MLVLLPLAGRHLVVVLIFGVGVVEVFAPHHLSRSGRCCRRRSDLHLLLALLGRFLLLHPDRPSLLLLVLLIAADQAHDATDQQTDGARAALAARAAAVALAFTTAAGAGVAIANGCVDEQMAVLSAL